MAVWLGMLFRFLGVPGMVRRLEWHDKVSGQHIVIHPHPGGTDIVVDGRCYSFSLTGYIDGTGSMI